jgi:hypothetical protein
MGIIDLGSSLIHIRILDLTEVPHSFPCPFSSLNKVQPAEWLARHAEMPSKYTVLTDKEVEDT